MLMASVPDVLRVPDAIAMFTHLGYPAYLHPFIGVAKILGVIAILLPGAAAPDRIVQRRKRKGGECTLPGKTDSGHHGHRRDPNSVTKSLQLAKDPGSL
jgi:hypothetical protein